MATALEGMVGSRKQGVGVGEEKTPRRGEGAKVLVVSRVDSNKMTSRRYFSPVRDFTPSKWKEITLKILERHKRHWES